MQQKEGREMGTAGKPKWFPPPLLTPRIFHLPWGIRWKQPTKDDAPKPLTTAAADPALRQSLKSKPVAFFDQGRRFSYSYPPEVLLKSGERRGRGRVVESDDEERENGGDNILEEKWRFEVDMLRAECKFLRMENEIAVKKSQRERAYFEGTLKSAVHTLISGKKKFREGKSVNAVFEEEIGELATKLVELQRSPRLRDADLQNCCNFDKLASLLQRKLEKLSSSSYERSILAIHSAKHGIARDFASNRKCSSFDETKDMEEFFWPVTNPSFGGNFEGEMEGLSKGKLLRKMEEEYRSLLSTIANYSVAGSASTSRRYDLPDTPSSLLRQPLQVTKSGDLKTCSGSCKAIMSRIVEQVRAEIEEWSPMQEVLSQARKEMDELQASRDFWKDRALESDHKIRSLHSLVQAWKQKSLSLEMKEKQLQKQAKILQEELETLWMIKQGFEVTESRERASICWEATPQLEKEKRVLTCRVTGHNQTCENDSKRKDGEISERKHR